MGIIEKAKRSVNAVDKLADMITKDLYDTMEELLEAKGYEFFVRLDSPNPTSGRMYDTNAPEDERKELHNQAVEKVKVHHNSQGYPPQIVKMVNAMLDQAVEK